MAGSADTDAFLDWYREMKEVVQEIKSVLILSRDAILKADDIKRELVEVKDWGGSVYVKAMTGAERDKFEEDSLVRRGKRRETNLLNFRARLVVRTVVGDDGKRLFADDDADALGEKSAAVLDRLYDVAARLSGISDEDVNELVGESASGQSDDSGTA